MEVECPKCKHKFEVNFECKRCGHEWTPRNSKPPKVCPKCKSPYWDRERTRATKKSVKKRLPKT